jgi:hypothetical protein
MKHCRTQNFLTYLCRGINLDTKQNHVPEKAGIYKVNTCLWQSSVEAIL